jgi:putative methyltransferase (TIGR01177 family)
LKNKSLVLLSGERTSIPEAEARALFLTYDPNSRFVSPEERVLIVHSSVDPLLVASRVAFARRVGLLISDPSDAADAVKGKKVRMRIYSLSVGGAHIDWQKMLQSIDAEIDLENPDFEFTVVEGKRRYLALSSPLKMNQGWSLRRPRQRAFFHPSAIFPKLSRALVNLSRCRAGDLFLDPFAGTGSLPLEAAEVGAKVLAVDQSEKMTRGSLANMMKFGQQWLGVVRCDSFLLPLRRVDAIATDVPYGRAASTRGRDARNVVQAVVETMPALLSRGSRMVMMHPNNVPVGPASDWALEEEHHLYVHKALTRTITVLRRK